jgi:surfactin synthase thioesterase subunit
VSAGRRITPTASAWLWNLRPPSATEEPTASTAVIMPHAGGSISTFLDWVPAIPRGMGVLGAQYPGRGPRLSEPQARSMAELVEPLTTQLLRLPAPPARLVLVGHSLGALVALEVARALERHGRPAHALLASSARAPDATTLFAGRRVPHGPELADALHRWGGLPPAVLDHAELLDLVLESVHDDLVLLEEYARGAPQPGPPVSCRVAVACGRCDPLVPTELIGGWARVSDQEVPLYLLEGGHFHAGTDVPRVGDLIGELAGITAGATSERKSA